MCRPMSSQVGVVPGRNPQVTTFNLDCSNVLCVNVSHTIELSNQAGLQGILASSYIALCHCGAQVHPFRSKGEEKL